MSVEASANLHSSARLANEAAPGARAERRRTPLDVAVRHRDGPPSLPPPSLPPVTSPTDPLQRS
eukprot:706569-Prorocentrum_minimum.AAC.1